MTRPHWLTGGFRPFFLLGSLATLDCAGLAWAAAYLAFAVGYGRMLIMRRT